MANCKFGAVGGMKTYSDQQIKKMRQDWITYGFEQAQKEFYREQENILQQNRVADIKWMNMVFLETLMRLGWGYKRLCMALDIMYQVQNEVNADKLTIEQIAAKLAEKGLQIVPDGEDADEAITELIKEARRKANADREEGRCHR